MDLFDVLKPELVLLEMSASGRREAVVELVACLRNDPRVTDADRFLEDILAREDGESTYLGFETGMPHARSDAVREMVIAVGRSGAGVDFGGKRRAKLIVVVGGPRRMATEYLAMVGAVARALKQDAVRKRLFEAGDAETFVRILAEAGSGI